MRLGLTRVSRCTRFSLMRSIDDITSDLLAGDGTVPVTQISPPSAGFVVGINGRGLVCSQPSSSEVAEWVASQRTRAAQPAHHLGSWADSETGLHYFDLVRVFGERASAEDFGRSQGEIAIYDMGNQSEIRL